MSETMVPANGVDLCVETFGERADPALLLIASAATSMDWWEDEFCRRLAAGGRFVVRYDQRDTGRSTSFPAGAPPYALAYLADDAVALLDVLELGAAHLVGMSLGGELAERIAVEHPDRALSVTVIAVRPEPAACASTDRDHTDWWDRKSAVDRLVTDALRVGGPFTADEPYLRRLAEREFDRTTDMVASRANHGMIAAGPPGDDRLAAIAAPTLILHGTQDPLVPMAAARALAQRIPGARLVALEGAGHEYPPAALWPQVITELLRLPA
jgi:pimeloyl-ACP methyl ester carboxylesterase